MKTIAFIPVRGGSKSIPLKNIKELMGKPLVLWSLEAASQCPQIDEIYVATDSEDIKSVVASAKLPKVFIYDRQAENAKDSSSTESVMLEFLKAHPLSATDRFILIQATNPFTQSKHLTEALLQYQNNSADSLLSVVESKRFFWTADGLAKNYDYLQRPRRQDFEPEYMENGAFYISSVQNILNAKNRLSGKIELYIMPEYTSYELDEPDDWVIVEELLKQKSKPQLKTKAIKLFLTDVDGVLTDAGMYYSEAGEELKKFNTRDGKGFEILKKSGIKVGIITSENTHIVERRAKKLGIEILHQGVKDKLPVVKDICTSMNIQLSEVAYIGDDINDLEVLKAVGYPACPADAVSEVAVLPNILKTHAKGGEGAVREFIEAILRK